jgi:hypothetical protein
MRVLTTLVAAAVALFGATSCETSARTEPGCAWSERKRLPPVHSAFLSMIFAGPKDQYKPLRLLHFNGPAFSKAELERLRATAESDPLNYNSSGIDPKYYSDIDKSLPFELYILVTGLVGKTGVSSSLYDSMSMPNMRSLAYRKHWIEVVSTRNIDPAIFGYFNVIPQTDAEFAKNDFLFSQSPALNGLSQVSESYAGRCRIRAFYGPNELKYMFIMSKINDGSELSYNDGSVCEARAQALMFGFDAFTIPRILEAKRTYSMAHYSGRLDHFGDMTQFLLVSEIHNALRRSKASSYSEVCSFVKLHKDPPNPFRPLP